VEVLYGFEGWVGLARVRPCVISIPLSTRLMSSICQIKEVIRLIALASFDLAYGVANPNRPIGAWLQQHLALEHPQKRQRSVALGLAEIGP